MSAASIDLSLIESLSFDKLISNIGFGKYQTYLMIALSPVSIADGTEAFVLSLLLPIFEKNWMASEFELSLIGTMVFFGYLIGSFLAGPMADIYGRRTPLIISTGVWTIFAVLSVFSQSVYDFMIYRFIFGIVVGFVWPIAFSLLTEYCPIDKRGKYLNIFQLVYPVGQIVAVWIAYFTLDTLTSGNWRGMLGLSSLPAFISFVCCFFFVDESARFELQSGLMENPVKTLKKMSKFNGKPENFINEEKIEALKTWSRKFVENEEKERWIKEEKKFMIEMKEGWMREEEEKEKDDEKEKKIKIKREHSNRRGELWAKNFYKDSSEKIGELFKNGHAKTTIIIWMSWFTNTFIYYGLSIVVPLTLVKLQENQVEKEQPQFTKLEIFWDLTVTNFAEMLGSISCGILVDFKSFGRKGALIWMTFLCGMLCFPIYFQIGPSFIFWLSILRYLAGLVNNINYIYTSEIYPTKIRATGMGMASSVCRLAPMLVPWMVIYLTNVDVFLPYLIFGAVGLVGWGFLMGLERETLGEELDIY